MSKFLKAIFVAVLFFLIISIMNFSFADNSTNSSSNSISDFSAMTDSSAEVTTKSSFGRSNSNDNTAQNSNTTQPSAKITSLSESNLQFSNILNILLIVLGTLLVLLAIAILIRLRR